MPGKVTPIAGRRRKATGPLTLRGTVDAALTDMTWLAPSDDAAVGLARAQADAIDSAEDRAKAVGWIGPQLLATIRALGGTPGDRKALGVEAPVKGKLAQLREQAARGKTG